MDDSSDHDELPDDEDQMGVERRTISPDSSTAEYDLLEIVASLEGCEIEDLPSLYESVEHMVENLFRTPPAPSAQMEITFSYAGYRITIARSGDVKLVPVKASLRD